MKKKVEIMAPAGSFESLQASLKAGANSVYFGVEQLNMRTKGANNFKTSDLKEIVKTCKKHKAKSYLALNTILYDEDLKLMKKMCQQAKEASVSAIIASDLAVIQYAHSLGLEVHISTQQNISNIESVRFFAQYADVVVLARELTLKQIKEIVRQIKKEKIKGPSGKLIKIEIFAHGALCMSVAGKCYMSLGVYNSSANRGACLQNCRRSYLITDEETGDELIIDNKYVLSPKDLCTIGFLDQIIEAGVSILKIEGRGRNTEYVFKTTKIYKEAAESALNEKFTKAKAKKWIKELESVFNRGLWQGGYYLGKKLGEWSNSYGSQATNQKIFLGQVKRYIEESSMAEILLETGALSVGEKIMLTGPKIGIIEKNAESIFSKKGKRKKVTKGELIQVPVGERVYEKDKFYKLVERKK